MNCSPCGSGSNYTSISTPNCVTLCGAGISTFVTNPFLFTLSTINISSFNVENILPSTISTFIMNPFLNVNIPSTVSTYVMNPSFIVNIPSTVSTYVTNPFFTVNIPSTVSTYITNPYLNVNIPSTVNVSTIGNVSIEGNVYDTFSRLVTATPITMLAAHTAFTPQYEILGYQSTGSASIVVDTSNSIVLMSTIGTGGRAVRQTLEYQLYQPGKSHQAYMTWVPQYSGTFDDSVTVRCGIYDDYRDKNTPSGAMGAGAATAAYVSSIYGGLGVETNQYSMGHFFELTGSTWYVVERANSSDNIANVTRVEQSNWNVDTLNSAYGRNPSGYQLSKSVEQLFYIERQWLGVGIVRMGVFSSGNAIVCHIFQNRALKQPYTHLNKLPIRYEIEKTSAGSTNAATTASICMASQIDGEYTPIGANFSLPASVVSATTRIDNDRLYPVLLLRLQQRYCRATFKIKIIEVFGAQPGLYTVLKNPTISGTVTWINHPDSWSMMQYAVFGNGNVTPTNTITGGQVLFTGVYDRRSTQTSGQSVLDLIAATSFCSDIKGNPDIFCLALQGFSDNINTYSSATWLEIT